MSKLKIYTELMEDPLPLQDSRAANRECAKITERHLQALWWEQNYFKPLFTSNGQSLTIISPGQWNVKGGPDFRKAHLRLDNTDIKGDIEIHLTDADGMSTGTIKIQNTTILSFIYPYGHQTRSNRSRHRKEKL
jgi:hypothetical protein